MNVSNVGESQLGDRVLRKLSWRLLVILGVAYGIAYVDRVNVSFAALQMNQELHFSASTYGLGAGLFFLGYAAFEIPSNMMLVRVGPRKWLSRILLTWGVLAAGMMFVQTPGQFYFMRFLLGVAEAGFFPGAIYYLTLWFPAEYHARAISRFYVGVPIASILMAAFAGLLLGLGGIFGLSGWQWLFLLEGLPAIALGGAFLFFLTDSFATAGWLTSQEKAWLSAKLNPPLHNAPNFAPSRFGQGLRNSRIHLLGFCSFCIMTSSYGYALSAPLIIQKVAGLKPAEVGYVMAGMALFAAFSMIIASRRSDRAKERYFHVIVPLLAMAGTLFASGFALPPWIVVGLLGFASMCSGAVQGVFWSIPSGFVRGEAAAGGLATIGAISMTGAFAGPALMGMAFDRTGNYGLGLHWLGMPAVLGAFALLKLRRISFGNSDMLLRR